MKNEDIKTSIRLMHQGNPFVAVIHPFKAEREHEEWFARLGFEGPSS
jgi:hypothetical protein